MKHSIFQAITAIAILASCQQTPKNEFTINGSIPGDSLDGKMVLLYPGHSKKTPIDTSYIKKNTFVFKQVVTNPEYLMVSFIQDKRYESKKFFSEANSTVDIILNGKESKVSGTPLNDTYSLFIDQLNQIGEEYMTLSSKVRDPKTKDEDRQIAKKKMDQLMEDYSNITLKTTLDNSKNIIGATILPQAMDQLKPQEVINLIDSMPSYLRDSNNMNKLHKASENSLRSQEGMPYIDFELQTTEGKSAKLSDFVAKNKIVVIDFWASWCGPCRRSLPAMKKIYNKFHKKGMEIVGVSLDSKKEAWIKAIKEEGITWPQISDIQGWKCKASKLYGVRGIPSMFIINEDGKIILSNTHNVKDVEKKLNELLK